MTTVTIELTTPKTLRLLHELESLHLLKILKKNTVSNVDESVFDIPKEHKQIVRQRIKKYKDNPESYLTWENIEEKLVNR